MSRPFAFLVAFSVTALAAGTAAADAPKYDELPSGHVTTAPPKTKKGPGWIGARESVPGFFIASQDFPAQAPASSRYVTVVGTAGAAASIKHSGSFDSAEDQRTCFAEATNRWNPFADDANDGNAQEWNPNPMWQANLWPKSADNPSSGVGLIHSERVVEKDGVATLESTDAWVDPSTHGARLAGKASLPLKLVGTAIGGIKVFAGRDTEDGKAVVQYIVVRNMDQAKADRLQNMSVSHGFFGMRSGSCGHVRVSLPAEPKSGETAVVLAPIELPGGEPSAEKKIVASPVVMGPKGAMRKLQRGMPSDMHEVEMRTRDVQIHLSVSQTSHDKEPVLTVSYGWAGRETQQRVFVPGTAESAGDPALNARLIVD